MAQIFHPRTNSIARASLWIFLLLLALSYGIIRKTHSSPYLTETEIAIEQPVPFSHQHHVQEIGIDCRYCHTHAETAAIAGIPSSAKCMNCHSQIHSRSEMLEPVRNSAKSGIPLKWNRVHDLPDFVYFNHSVHLRNGIGCVSCHGDVSKMSLTWKVTNMPMEWCLKCHRNPVPHLRPQSELTHANWTAQNGQILKDLEEQYKPQKRTDCYHCHR